MRCMCLFVFHAPNQSVDPKRVEKQAEMKQQGPRSFCRNGTSIKDSFCWPVGLLAPKVPTEDQSFPRLIFQLEGSRLDPRRSHLKGHQHDTRTVCHGSRMFDISPRHWASHSSQRPINSHVRGLGDSQSAVGRTWLENHSICPNGTKFGECLPADIWPNCHCQASHITGYQKFHTHRTQFRRPIQRLDAD